MRVRITAPVAFNGERRVYEGEEFDIPDDALLYPWMERIDAPVVASVKPVGSKAAGKVGAKAPAKPQLRELDTFVG